MAKEEQHPDETAKGEAAAPAAPKGAPHHGGGAAGEPKEAAKEAKAAKSAGAKEAGAKEAGAKEARGEKGGKDAKAKSGKGAAKAGGEKDADPKASAASAPRLKARYRGEVAKKLQERFKIANRMATPRLLKIVVNVGCKGATENKGYIDQAVRDLAAITGQQPVVRKARTSIANFKLRKDMPIGVKVTLRGDRMWEFADRLMSVVLPRIRDFRGVRTKLDGRGNYSLGLAEQTVFPEVDFEKVEFAQGMDITFVTDARSDERAYYMLKELGMPFQESGK
jgi:large subunit ribosomal protein L5